MTRVPPMLALACDRTIELRAHYEDSRAIAEHVYYQWCLDHGYEGEADRALDRCAAHLDRAEQIRKGAL